MFGYKDDEVENKNKIEQLEEQMEMLENKIANIMDVLEIQEEDVDDDIAEEEADYSHLVVPACPTREEREKHMMVHGRGVHILDRVMS